MEKLRTGSLALLLHAHLPFVRHPEHPDFLEEDWLHEAVVETYVPLLRIFQRLAAERVPYRLTITMTPTLCEMLRDPLLVGRIERYLERGVELAAAEIERTAHSPELCGLARFYEKRFRETREFFVNSIGRDVVGAFAELQDGGFLDIITCAATHGFLPLMERFPEAIRAQILCGCDSYREHFGCSPRGIWLPECAYVPGVADVLREADLRWFVVDAHGLMFGTPKPRFAIFSAYHTPAGPAFFGRDRDSSRQVWSAREGYPGDPAYRDFYRDIGQDLPLEYLSGFMPVGHRRFTGIKYHRITGSESKELYNRLWAEKAADSHAGNFFDSRLRQIRDLVGVLPIEPIVVSPFDAELFGHWWFEGPEFLELFIRKAVFDQDEFMLSTPGDYLQRNPTQQLVAPAPSSWGNNGYWEVWLDQSNSWIYPHLHAAATRMIRAAKRFAKQSAEPSGLQERMLRQMGRELLLAQSSDWAFLMKTGTAREYATRRTKDHVLRFMRLDKALEGGDEDLAFLEFCENRDNLFQNLSWRHWA